jgi:hypothetical protein
MTDYIEISDAEVAPGQPAFASVLLRQRNNLTAVAQGDGTITNAQRINPYGFKRVSSGSVRIADQGTDFGFSSFAGIGLKIKSSLTFFRASIIVPGTYTITGTATSVTVTIAKNGTTVSSGTGARSEAIVCVSGDILTVTTGATSPDSVLQDFRLVADYIPPIGQCQFFMHQELTDPDS